MLHHFTGNTLASEPFNLSQQKRSKDKRAVLELLKYVNGVHCINVPDDFATQLLEAHFIVSESPFNMHEETVDGIIRACKKWRQYLSDQTDFDRLVCHELISMATSHAAVLSVYFTEKAGFNLVENKPVPSYAIIVNHNGDVSELR